MRLRARDVCLAVVVLVLVGTGLHAVVGEFTHHSWRTAIRGVNGGFPGVVPGRQCVAVSGGFARRSWATLSPFWARRRGACLWRGGASLASIGSCRGLCGCFIFHDGFVTPHHERHGRGGYEGFRPAMCSGMIDTFEVET